MARAPAVAGRSLGSFASIDISSARTVSHIIITSAIMPLTCRSLSRAEDCAIADIRPTMNSALASLPQATWCIMCTTALVLAKA